MSKEELSQKISELADECRESNPMMAANLKTMAGTLFMNEACEIMLAEMLAGFAMEMIEAINDHKAAMN